MGLTTSSSSPGITVREFDLTGVAPNVDTSIAGFVGEFKWGPVDECVTIQNEGELALRYGTPDPERAVDYFSAAQFLKYSGNLIINRTITSGTVAAGDSAINASNQLGGTSTLVKNRTDWENQYSAITHSFTAKYPGAMGSSIAVSIFGAATDSAATATAWESWTYKDRFSTYPFTSDFALKQPLPPKSDEVHVAVIDSDGLISGTPGTVLETFDFLSVIPGAKTADDDANYIGDVLNASSNYVWFRLFDDNVPHGTAWGFPPATATTPAAPADGRTAGTATNYSTGYTYANSTANTKLSGTNPLAAGMSGQDCANLDEGDYQIGWAKFDDVDTIDVQILIAPGMTTSGEQISVVNNMNTIASVSRKDCIVVSSPDRNAVIGNNTPVASTLTTTDLFDASSYLTVDNNYLRVYDKYNDQYIYIPAASTTAGIMAFSDFNYGPWWSPAGEKRGAYSGVAGLAYSPNKTERDMLYKKGVNPIVQFPGRGTLLWGDKTKLARPSAFDRIPTRRLFLAIEKSIAISARNFLFEINDEFTRSEFVAVIEPLLREIQARRGIQDFRVQCDETNNTAATIDRNELVATVFVKPARSIYFITINFVATRTGADFEEIISSGIRF